MLTNFDSLKLILFSFLVLTGTLFAVTVLWKFPKQTFWMIFLFRPLLELSRLLEEETLFIQWVINGVGVAIPSMLLLVIILRRKLLLYHNLPVIAFFLATVLTSMAHEKSYELAEILIRCLIPLIILIFPQCIFKGERDVTTFLRVVGISTAFVLIAVILDWNRTNINPITGMVQDVIHLKSGEIQNRLGAVFGVPTVTGFWLFQFFAVTYFLFEIDGAVRRWLWIGICIALVYPIFLTFSRTTWLACWFLLFTYSLLKVRLKLVSWIVGIAVLTVILFPDILYRFSNFGSFYGRIAFWSGYLQAITSGGIWPWLIGLGWVNLPDKNILSGHLVSYGSTGFVENSFLFLLAGAGLIPLIIFIIIFLNLAHCAWRLKTNGHSSFVRDYGIWTLSMLGAWFLMSMSGDMVSYVIINWYWYAFFGCTIVLWAKTQRLHQSGDIQLEVSSLEPNCSARNKL